MQDVSGLTPAGQTGRPNFSGTRAIGAGFRLIGREPLAFLAWTATYIVVCLLPSFGMMSVVLPAWSQMMREVAAAGSHPGAFPPAGMLEMQAKMMQLQPLVLLASLVGHTLILGAIYRAMLFPQDRGFLYLRIGARELWLGLAMLVLTVLLGILMFCMVLVVGILGGIIGAVSHAPAGLALMAPLAFCLILGVMLWVGLRLSFALPMSFSAPGFRLYESWGATRGLALKMFLVTLAFVVIVWLAEVAILAVVLGLVGGFAGLQTVASWMQHPQFDLRTTMPFVVGGGLVGGLLSTAITTLIGAGWAEIYREAGPETLDA
jgi:hypothetical protein